MRKSKFTIPVACGVACLSPLVLNLFNPDNTITDAMILEEQAHLEEVREIIADAKAVDVAFEEAMKGLPPEEAARHRADLAQRTLAAQKELERMQQRVEDAEERLRQMQEDPLGFIPDVEA